MVIFIYTANTEDNNSSSAGPLLLFILVIILVGVFIYWYKFKGGEEKIRVYRQGLSAMGYGFGLGGGTEENNSLLSEDKANYTDINTPWL